VNCRGINSCCMTPCLLLSFAKVRTVAVPAIKRRTDTGQQVLCIEGLMAAIAGTETTEYLDRERISYQAFADAEAVLGGSAVRRCSAGRRCSRRRMPCSPRSAPPPVRGWAVPMIRRTRSASSAALSGRTSFCCPRRSPAAGVGACFRCSSSGMLRPLPSAFSAGFGAACSRFSLSDGPNTDRSTWASLLVSHPRMRRLCPGRASAACCGDYAIPRPPGLGRLA
jgi:hypothetical protein